MMHLLDAISWCGSLMHDTETDVTLVIITVTTPHQHYAWCGEPAPENRPQIFGPNAKPEDAIERAIGARNRATNAGL